jgi:hypothetical protein
VLQAQSQLKAIYKDNMDTILGNCDTMLFLGGKEKTTLDEISKMLGKETIDMYNTSVTKGTQESHGQNFQKLGKDVLSCKGVESTAPILQGSSFICGTTGRLPGEKNYQGRNNLWVFVTFISVWRTRLQIVHKREFRKQPSILLLVEGCNRYTGVDGYANQTRKGACSLYQPYSNKKSN